MTLSNTLSFEDSIAMLNNPNEELNKLAHLNAAIWLYICEKHKSIDEAYQSLET